MAEVNLRSVADRQEITDLIYRYCRSMDRIDPELGYTIWNDGAVADYGADVYQGTGRGFIDFVCESHRKTLATSHQITNVIIQLDGDTAASEAYVTATIRVAKDDKRLNIVTWTRYLDQWSRQNGRWGIDKRMTIIDFDEITEVATMRKDSRGANNRTDPSYSILRGPS